MIPTVNPGRRDGVVAVAIFYTHPFLIYFTSIYNPVLAFLRSRARLLEYSTACSVLLAACPAPPLVYA